MRTADLAQRIFKAADVLRGKMDIAEYMRVISTTLVLKWASDHLNALTVPHEARWDRLIAAADSSPRDALDKAVTALAISNPDVFDDSFRHVVRNKRLSDGEVRQLIAILDEIPPGGEDPGSDDVTGRLYEQVLATFTDESRRGEFGTPRSVSQLLVRLADPQPGHSVYDPCAGTGGLLTAADTYVAERTGRRGALRLFGQEANEQACTIARLNLMLHGITNASVLLGDAIANPRHLSNAGGLKDFDRVLTNPPFGMRYGQEELSFPQQTRYGLSRLADLMFVQHVLASLTPDGVGVMVVPNGVLFRSGTEGRIRRGMVEDGRIAAAIAIGRNVFHGTSVPASVLVLRSEGAARASERDVLFINAEHEVDVTRSRTHLAPRHVERIATAFHERREIPHFSRLVSIEEITAKEFTLNVGDYIYPRPLARANLSIRALVEGGIPFDAVDAQVDQFAAFGIELADLFVPGRSGHLAFPRYGYETVAEMIPGLAAPSVAAFLTALEGWFQEFRQQQDVLTDRPPAAAREYFAEKFHHALEASMILNDEQVTGLFVDWWVTNQDDLNQLRRPVDSPSALTPGMRAATIDRIGADLSAQAKKLVTQQQKQLIDVYRAWGDQYKTSLADLERQREDLSKRLAVRLDELGYQWPLGG
ncbi:type I restriction enzyme M protein [Saccharothrix carnea]|uniref:site-specific DNA-methyltransferase (adenine-specific) n=1 Tax=Saccharothrix carnea TaxID=1280637 RepID=A0A2P8I482_SACCR|nr:type I restriction-modification system subunit M [Saccharothrix carnea]PSL53276.1 type I restriction enzyme M protein [Saccharothrix carnea]